MDFLRTLCGAWYDTFFSLVADCSSRLQLVAPYVKERLICDIFEVCKPEVEVCLVSRFSVAAFYRGASDLGAFQHILEVGANAYTVQDLHAKIYIFDGSTAVITSANLTNNGLRHSWEYGVTIADAQVVSTISQDVEALLAGESAAIVGPEAIAEAEQIIASAPPLPRTVLPEVDIKTRADEAILEPYMVFGGGVQAIRSGLTGWKLSVFDCLNRIADEYFTLAQVYQFTDELQAQYPDNQNVDAKIRQQLQFLAHLGLVQFLGRGKYRKLWESETTSS